MKKDEIKKRVLETADYVIKTGATVRQAADREDYPYAKTTVHLDLTKRLPEISAKKAKEVRKVLEKNKKECAMRGGIAASRIMWQDKRKGKNTK